MAAIRHYTSRGGDPHRHLHLQVNARVPAAGKWRGIDSAQLLRMQRAINGIGHRAVIADPEFRAALAAHGYTVDHGRGDRAARRRGPGDVETVRAGRGEHRTVRTAVAHRAPRSGTRPRPVAGVGRTGVGRQTGSEEEPPHPRPDCETAWITELRDLGVDVDAHLAAGPVPVTGVQVGAVDRDEAADRVLKVLGAGGRGRSTWNVYDIRGVTEEVLSARNVIAPPQVFQELAEDVTARAEARCLSVVDRPVPEHIRHLTSQAVIDLERDLHGRLAVRAAVDHTPATVAGRRGRAGPRRPRLTVSERCWGRGRSPRSGRSPAPAPLVLVEGAAGAGKTTVLAAANDIITAPRAAR